MTPVARHISTYLHDHLPQQRGASPHTCDSYAITFQLLFLYAAKKLKCSPSKVTLEQLNVELISSFLEQLETDRQNVASTRNVRLAAIKSFFHFLEFREPTLLAQIRRVLAIPFKKTAISLVPYLQQNEVQALLDAPDPKTWEGIRDRAMLHVAVCGGLRVSELTGLRLEDVRLADSCIRIHGKGRRERVLPLWKPAVTAVRAWLAIRGTLHASELFVNARGEPLTRWGFAYVLKQHVDAASKQLPSLKDKRISPHVLRHTCAMIVLQSTKDIRKVSLWLGHSQLATTEIYTRADPSEKLEALNVIVPPQLRRGAFRAPDKLIAMLKAKN